MNRILIVEDDLILADGLKVNLVDAGYQVENANTGERVFEILNNQNMDLVLLDVNLPGMDGFEVCRRIKSQNNIPVIFLTARDMEIDEVRGFDSGADDYIKKPFSVSVLQCRITAVLERYGKSKSKDIWSDGYLTIDFASLCVIIEETEVPITAFEYKLLKLFINNQKMVLTRRILLEKLWDNDKEAYVDEHALTVSINRLRSKLEKGSHKYIKTIYGMGYTWVGEIEDERLV